MSDFFLRTQSGISILGVIFSIAVLVLLIIFTAGPLSDFRNRQVLISTAEQLHTLFEQARAETLSSKKDSQYGVHLEEGRAVFFKGASFSEPQNENIEIVFHRSVYLSDINLNGGGSDVVFDRLTGTTDQFGTTTLAFRNNASTTKTIVITPAGVATLRD